MLWLTGMIVFSIPLAAGIYTGWDFSRNRGHFNVVIGAVCLVLVVGPTLWFADYYALHAKVAGIPATSTQILGMFFGISILVLIAGFLIGLFAGLVRQALERA